MSDSSDRQVTTWPLEAWPSAKDRLAGERGWFRSARFGVFVHFGLYTLLGGNENDRQEMSVQEYADRLLPQFNPTAFDAAEWVRQVQGAGAKYIVLTTKHGEGFCLWDTKSTDFNVMQAPYGRDIVRQLADACHAAGLRLGLYCATDNWRFSAGGDHEQTIDAYCEYFGTQIRELMTHYGQVDELWLDGSAPLLPPDRLAGILNEARALQPSLVIDDRGVHHNDTADAHCGDFITPERFFPDRTAPGHPFIEVCDAMGLHGWGYHAHEVFHSTPVLIERLCHAASIGGNYLLNVEPQPDGRFRPECAERLAQIGAWMDKHREAVFDAAACPALAYARQEQNRVLAGRCTRAGRTVYVMLRDWPVCSALTLPGVRGEVSRVALMDGEAELDAEQREDGLALRGLAGAGPANSVIKLEFASEPALGDDPARTAGRTVPLEPAAPTLLKATDAELLPSNDGMAWNRVEHYPNGNVSVGRWVRLSAGAVWRLNVERPGQYRLFAQLGTNEDQAGARACFRVGEGAVQFTTEANGWYGEYRCYEIGVLDISAGRQELELTIENMKFFSNVHGLILVPVQMTDRHQKEAP